MPDARSLSLFVLAALVVVVTPGPGVLYVVARSLAQGRLAGLVSVLGGGTGTLLHVAAAALGVSAVVAASPLAFGALRLLGGLYLVALGVRQFRAATGGPVVVAPRESFWKLYAQGIVVSVLNPNNVLFFLAFLPQFVKPERGPVPQQMTVLGLVFVAIALLSDGAWALAAGSAGGILSGRGRAAAAQRYVVAPLLVLLGLFAIATVLSH
jgi:threonine/homoserine/homoserine lactone efflux protein